MANVEAIIQAVKSRDSGAVKALLAEDPSLAHVKADGESILLTAVWYGAKECLEYLREAKGVLELDEAIGLNDMDRVEQILREQPEKAGAFLADGGTPLRLAAFLNRREMAERLLDAGAEIDALSLYELPNIPRNTALHAAIAGQAWETAKLLVERGANVNVRDSIGGIPLHNAAARNHVETVRLLIAAGAEVSARNKAGLTPLALAISRGHQEAAACLREHGGVE